MTPVAPNGSGEDLNGLLNLLSASINPVAPNHFTYQPHEKQRLFHSSKARGRIFLGGNRSGKTVAGANEAVEWSYGDTLSSFLPPPPIRGRIVTVDFKNGAEEIIIPALKQWFPASALVDSSWDASYNKNTNLLTLDNGSTIKIMSHEQDLDKFAGVPLHWVWFDEEPPQDIWKESVARLSDYNGRWWMTMTPVNGMTWTYDELYTKQDEKQIEIIEVDQDENPYLDEEGRKAGQADLDEDEIAIRKQGKYIAIHGLVFKKWNQEQHVVPEFIPDPRYWTHYRSFDHGFSNPTAILWHAVNNQSGNVVTWREHYKAEWTVDQHAEFIKADEDFLRKTYGIIPFVSVADPAIQQRQAATGLSVQIMYSQHGIYWALCKVRDVSAGLIKMNEYVNQVKWQITEACPNTIKEVRKYKRGSYSTQKLRDKNNKKEEPQKKDDHAIDSTRYFFSFMPDLNPPVAGQSRATIADMAAAIGAGTTPMRRDPFEVYDKNLRRSNEIVIIGDEYVGEW